MVFHKTSTDLKVAYDKIQCSTNFRTSRQFDDDDDDIDMKVYFLVFSGKVSFMVIKIDVILKMIHVIGLY
jgi:hypothetical protein